MTKTKKNLSWKLPELPTGGELADMVDSGILSVDEAREVALGSAENDKEVIKTLQDQIEFLQDLVKDLSRNRTTTYIPTFAREITVTKPYFEKYWMSTSKALGDAGYTLTTGAVSGTSGSGMATYNAGSHSGGNVTPAVMNVSLSQKTDTIS